jgi:hypothetical protein
METAQVETLGQWWDNIKTESVALKLRYFFRNQSAIRSCCKVVDASCELGERWTSWDELLAFMGTHGKLTCHRAYSYAPCGCYSLVGDDFEFVFRVDDTKRGPELCLCNAAALSESGNWVSIL